MASIIKVDRILDSTELGKVDIPGGIETDVLNATELIADTWKNVDGTENYKCKCWVNFDGSTTPPTIRASGNVSSVVRNAAGIYVVNMVFPLIDTSYVVVLGVKDKTGVGYPMASIDKNEPMSTTSFGVRSTFQVTSTTTTTDCDTMTLAVFR